MKKYSYVKEFVCASSSCPDTCCKDWDMVIDEPTRKSYESHRELKDLIEQKDSAYIIKRDYNGYCKKYSYGLCSLHRDHGTDLLSDVCHFYPRIYRSVENSYIVSATMSCPEIAKLCLFSNNPFELIEEIEDTRLPTTANDLQALPGQEALAIHQHFLALSKRENTTAEEDLQLISTIINSLNYIDREKWGDALTYLDETSPHLITTPAAYQPLSSYQLLLALVNIISALKKPRINPRLLQTITEIEYLLQVRVNWEKVSVDSENTKLDQSKKLKEIYQAREAEINIILKRWLQGQIVGNFFPFNGLGDNIVDRKKILTVRFATVRLALLALYNLGNPSMNDIIRVIQSLSKHMDHLADPTFSLTLYKEFKWEQEAELQSLILGEKSLEVETA
jgi:lysine-N-methylase